MSRSVFTMFAIATLVVALGGCSQGGTDSAAPAPIAEPSAQDTPPRAAIEPPTPAPQNEPVAGPIAAPGANKQAQAARPQNPQPQSPQPQSSNDPKRIISNESFENWIDGLPVVWMGNYTADGMTPEDHVAPVDVAQSGTKALRLRAEGKRIAVWQYASVGIESLGKTVVAEAYIKNPVPGGLIFRFTYDKDEEPVYVDGEVVEEGEEWSLVRLSFEMPKDVNPNTSKISFVIRNFVSAPAIVDSVSVRVE